MPPLADVVTCPPYELITLPNKQVRTHDGKELKCGMLVYHRLTLGRALQYVVVSDKAVRRGDRIEVILLGPPGIPLGKDPNDFVKNLNEWRSFCARRGASSPQRTQK